MLCFYDIFADQPEQSRHVIRLAVRRNHHKKPLRYHYEYVAADQTTVALDEAIELVEQLPARLQFMARVDLDRFMREDFEDAIAGKLIEDDVKYITVRPDQNQM